MRGDGVLDRGSGTVLASAIIPAYNQGGYLVEAIGSVLRQTLANLEVIVVDDGSTDGTAQAAQGFDDPRVRYVYQDNRGLSAARNTGIRYARGRYLTFLDADDLFLPQKLELLVGALEKHPEIGMAAGQAIPIDEHGHPVGRIFDKPLPDEPARLLMGNPLHVGSVVVRASWQARVGFFDESLRSYEDWDMWLRLALAGCRAVWVPRPVSCYRFHRFQMTRSGQRMTAACFAVLDKVFARSDLPESWRRAESIAYSRAHLRAAAQAYLARDFGAACGHLVQAVRRDPSLLEGDARRLADHFRSWTELPKVEAPLIFLEEVYGHLPPVLRPLVAQRKRHLADAALELASRAGDLGDLRAARRYGLRAFRYRPSLLLDWGIIKMSARAMLAGRLQSERIPCALSDSAESQAGS